MGDDTFAVRHADFGASRSAMWAWLLLGCAALGCSEKQPATTGLGTGAGGAGAHAVGTTAGAQPGMGPTASGVGGAQGPGQPATAGRSGTTPPGSAGGGGVNGGPAAGSGTPDSGSSGAGSAAPVDAGGPDANTGDASTAGDDLCDVGVFDGAARPRALSLTGNTFAHDPTMIEADGVYYRFWTGDNIPMASSTDLMAWRDGPSVYRNGYPAWSRDWLSGVQGETFNFPWAPDVSFFANQYHLYSSFSAKFGDNISCITHLTTSDIASGEWEDHGPVICTEGDERYNAIDAEVGLDQDGKAYLAFGSFWDGIMAFELTETGERAAGSELTRLAWAREIEAPVLLRRCGYYYLFVTWGLCCPGENRGLDQLTYRVAVGRSENILGPYVDKAGVSMVDGGGTLLVQGDATFAAAGHSDVLVTGNKIYHLYHAYRRPRGEPQLRIVEMPFDEDGWPVAAAAP